MCRSKQVAELNTQSFVYVDFVTGIAFTCPKTLIFQIKKIDNFTRNSSRLYSQNVSFRIQPILR
jgi:hypothetical protein